MSESWRWELLPQFKRELQGLGRSSAEQAKIQRTMVRFATGKPMPSDHKKLGDGLEELRISVNRGVVRLYFGRFKDTHVLVAAVAHVKKRSKDRAVEETARRRLKSYRPS